MVSSLVALGFGAQDPGRLATFWGALLGRELVAEGAVAVLPPPEDPGFPIRVFADRAPKLGPNQMHFDLTSTTTADQEQTVARALALGGRHIDVGQRADEGHVVLADPEGNEFCVVEPGNKFLAGCGVIGALSCDGSAAVGRFYSAALGWPLVWNQDEETAVQSPFGGSKISWGGPPDVPKTGRNRLHLDLSAPAGSELGDEVERLLGLGATRTDLRSESGGVVLADPDGNELCVLPPR